MKPINEKIEETNIFPARILESKNIDFAENLMKERELSVMFGTDGFTKFQKKAHLLSSISAKKFSAV